MIKNIFFKLIFCLFFLLFVSEISLAGKGDVGDLITEPYLPLVVQVTSQFAKGKENGFGFIVGEQDDYFFIVTANHVVRRSEPDNLTQKVEVRFFWDIGAVREVELLPYMYAPFDLALLRINKTNIFGAVAFSWSNQAWCRRWQDKESTWFIGRDKDWYVSSDQFAGTMQGLEADMKNLIKFNSVEIKPGTSGAPLIIKKGIVGMVLRDSGNEGIAISIEMINRFVKTAKYPWNLVECDGGKIAPEPLQIEPPPSPGDIMTEDFLGMKMVLVYVPTGCFQMGSPSNEKNRYNNEGPIHEVCVNGFWMGKNEVTQGEWRTLMSTNPARFKKGDNYPVEQVTWEKVQSFISKLNFKTGKKYRLPTEAEWEYAARAGTMTARYWGDSISCDKAMYENNNQFGDNDDCVSHVHSKGWDSFSTVPVGSYPENQFGINDMLGNVFEWCDDLYKEDYYGLSPKWNPQGASLGTHRVSRGGGWSDASTRVRVAIRKSLPPGLRDHGLGFRVVFPVQVKPISF